VTEKIKGLLFSVILIVVALLLLPIVINGVGTILSMSLSSYTGVSAIVALIPLLVVIGIVIVAIINGMWAMKKGK
jgi:hypothetical protein